MISLIEFTLIVGTASLTAAGASQGWQLLLQSRNNRSPHRAPSRQDDEASRPAAGMWHAPRHNHRQHASWQMNYLTAEGLTSGTLIDLSPYGWRVVGERPVMRGATLSMHVYLPDQSLPLDIEAATVRWTNGYEFGIELTTLSPEAAARLSNYRRLSFRQTEPWRHTNSLRSRTTKRSRLAWRERLVRSHDQATAQRHQ